MARFYESFQWDFLKLNPRSSYHNEAWGVRYTPSTNAFSKPTMAYTPIEHLNDWAKVIKTIPSNPAAFDFQLDAIEKIRSILGPDVPILQTVFSPLEILSRFLPKKWDLAAFIRTEYDLFEQIFENVISVILPFLHACIDAGVDGFFFATTWATHATSDAIFELFERKYDLRILQAVRPKASFLVLHVCGRNNRILEMTDYPVDILHWDWMNGENPIFETVERQTDKAIMGGVASRGLLQYGSAYRLYDFIERAVRPRKWIVSTECTYPPETPEDHIWAVRKAVADLRSEEWPR